MREAGDLPTCDELLKTVVGEVGREAEGGGSDTYENV